MITQEAYRKNRAKYAILTKELARVKDIDAGAADILARGYIAMITGGESSTKDLDAHGWAHLFNWFSSQGARLAAPKKARQQKQAPHPEALPTHRQKWLIMQLMDALGWEKKTLADWMESSFSFRFAKTRQEASMAIDGLKKVLIDQAEVAAKCRELLAGALNQADRALIWGLQHAIANSRNYGAAKPGEVLRVLEMYEGARGAR